MIGWKILGALKTGAVKVLLRVQKFHTDPTGSRGAMEILARDLCVDGVAVSVNMLA